MQQRKLRPAREPEKPIDIPVVFDKKLIKQALELLNKVKNDISNVKQDEYTNKFREYFHHISEAIRMTGSVQIQRDALNMTRTELQEYKINGMDDLMVVCNQVQFSSYEVEREYTTKIVDLALEFVTKCL
jgi:hypothetical protein